MHRGGAELDLYGLRVSVRGWPDVVEAVRLDYAWFEAAEAGAADVVVAIEQRSPDYESLPPLSAALVTPRNVVYEDGLRTIVDYGGRAVALFERASGRLTIQALERHLAHEAAYEFVLSQAGRHLDRHGLTRVHGLGLSGAQSGVLLLLPAGGGKTLLALRALGDAGVALLSEDSPLLDRRGRLHPFPLRIGVGAADVGAAAGSGRRIERLEYAAQVAVEVAAFSDRVAARPVPLRHLVVGRRSLGREARLEPVARAAAVGPLLREAVVGVGVYQGLEFLLQQRLSGTLALSARGVSRLRCCAAGLARAQVWRLTLGRDRERNWRALAPLLRDCSPTR
jgi:hypothetical protein